MSKTTSQQAPTTTTTTTTSKTTTTTNPTPATVGTVGTHPAWHVRFPGATPDHVTVEHAWSRDPEELHIVGAGSRDVVHGRWGHKLYYTWPEAIAASIEQQEAKIRQLDAEITAGHIQLERLRTLTEPEPAQPGPQQEQPQE